MKEIVLTIDYELFLGKETGTVRECLIEPTIKLASILDKNSSKMTIFWDILHYYRLLELENNYQELRQDRILIEEQILELTRAGHDIQLHLHPFWFDAKYENSKWNFNYNRFKLQSLSNENNPNNINTIIGCVSISKKIMESLIRKVKPHYKTTTFRAGGFLIEPFNEIRDAFLKNDIKIDSSICPDLVNNNGIFSYDFRFYSHRPKYNFEFTPKDIAKEGNFIEIPITTIKLPGIRNVYYKFLRRIKYPSLENERKGFGVGGSSSKKQKIKIRRLFSILLSPQICQYTTDSNFREKFNYLYKKAPDYSTMIIHSKLLNRHTLGILEDHVSSNKIRFISIQEYLS